MAQLSNPPPWGWMLVAGRSHNEDDHMLPTHDIREHCVNSDCWCVPKLYADDDLYAWEHFSLDGREDYETQKRLPS